MPVHKLLHWAWRTLELLLAPEKLCETVVAGGD